MRIDIISVLPELLESPLNYSIMKRAQTKGLVEVFVHNLKDFGLGKHRQVDDYAYGGHAGMVLMCEPLDNCIMHLCNQRIYDEVIYVTPDGKSFGQKMANRLSCYNNLMIICGHYKGIDQRIRDMHVTMELSIGDYVLSGGELAAAVIVDAVVRLIPGVLSDVTSALTDTFQDGLLAPPVYTRPENFKGHLVPAILLSGHDTKIEEWMYNESLERTKKLRPDILDEDLL
jgi:tRNA (guanine37-N1)-methyltransferase